jgi:hypothetical protein
MWIKEEFYYQRGSSIIVLIYKKDDETGCRHVIFIKLIQNCIQHYSLKVISSMLVSTY